MAAVGGHRQEPNAVAVALYDFRRYTWAPALMAYLGRRPETRERRYTRCVFHLPRLNSTALTTASVE